jgi:hypothetical protein
MAGRAMTRAALEHLLPAAAALTNETEFVLIGNQASLGQLPEAPLALLVSVKADSLPQVRPRLMTGCPPSGCSSMSALT